MTKPSEKAPSADRRRAFVLFGLLGFQTLCALFFLADVAADFLGTDDLLGGGAHHYLEAAVALALVLGIVFTAQEIRKVLQRQQSVEATLRAASGAFGQLMEDHFDSWSLTPSERDVALFAIKGLSIAEIAALRQTKEGTIKAQCNATYRKAGVSGRLQLLSLFIEELMGDGLTPSRRAVLSSSQPLPTQSAGCQRQDG